MDEYRLIAFGSSQIVIHYRITKPMAKPSFRYFKSLQDQGEDEYLGNIWGWKNSLIGLGLILFFMALYSYRAYMHPNTNPSEIKFELEAPKRVE